MGGYSSGRPAQYPIVESTRRLDIRMLRRRGWLRPGTGGVWTWTEDGEPTGSMSYRVTDDALELDYTVGDDENRKRVRINIFIVPTRAVMAVRARISGVRIVSGRARLS